MEFRILQPSDAGDFQALRLRGLGESPTAFASSYEEECETPVEVVAGRLSGNRNGAVFGAFDGQVLIGVAGVQREKMQRFAHKAYIWGVYVAPEFRQRGVARELMKRALAHAFSMEGVRQVNLGVNAANAPAVALYEALGFQPFGVERGFMMVDGVLQDEIHMVCFGEETELEGNA